MSRLRGIVLSEKLRFLLSSSVSVREMLGITEIHSLIDVITLDREAFKDTAAFILCLRHGKGEEDNDATHKLLSQVYIVSSYVYTANSSVVMYTKCSERKTNKTRN